MSNDNNDNNDMEWRLRKAINQIADQMCLGIDGNYDFFIETPDTDIDIQKLSMLTNFLLDSVRRHMTEMRRMRDELELRVRERTQRLDLILQGANDGIWEWDLENGEVRVSQRWREYTGALTPGQVLSFEEWLSLLHEDDREGFRRAIDAHLAGHTEHLRYEYRLRTEGGDYRIMVCRGICQRNDLGKAIRIAGTQSDLTERKYRDPITGLPNIAFLEHELSEHFRTASDQPLTLMLLGMPNRNALTLRMTHAETVTARRLVVDRLLTLIAPNEHLVMMPDISFALLLRREDADVLEALASAVRSLFEEPVSFDDHRFWVSIIMSSVSAHEPGIDSAEALLGAARIALRQARQSGLGAYQSYVSEIRQSSEELVQIEQHLRSAIRNNGVRVHLQPLVDFRKGRVSGFEALSRIELSDGALLSPGLFIPVAEESGLIRPLSERMIDLSLPLLNDPRLLQRYGADFELAINLSPTQLHDPHLPKQLEQKLQALGASPRRLKLEITESSVMESPALALSLINQFRDMGMRIALDDFGTGYSSLGYLRTLPLDVIKIDRSLVSGIHEDVEKRAILEMIISLCERLNLEVLVEGIEDEAELSCLLGLGATSGQGYLFGRPMPVDLLVQTIPASGFLATPAP